MFTFLNKFITGDEKLTHHSQQESKWQSMEWKQSQSPSKKQTNKQNKTKQKPKAKNKDKKQKPTISKKTD
jgi:hypothetical protein